MNLFQIWQFFFFFFFFVTGPCQKLRKQWKVLLYLKYSSTEVRVILIKTLSTICIVFVSGGGGGCVWHSRPLSGVAKTVPGDEDGNNGGFRRINHYSSSESTRKKHTTSKNYLKFLLLPKRSHYSCPKSVRPIFLKISCLVCIRLCQVFDLLKKPHFWPNLLFLSNFSAS